MADDVIRQEQIADAAATAQPAETGNTMLLALRRTRPEQFGEVIEAFGEVTVIVPANTSSSCVLF